MRAQCGPTEAGPQLTFTVPVRQPDLTVVRALVAESADMRLMASLQLSGLVAVVASLDNDRATRDLAAEALALRDEAANDLVLRGHARPIPARRTAIDRVLAEREFQSRAGRNAIHTRSADRVHWSRAGCDLRDPAH